MRPAFGALLAQLRAEAGFPSAYRFYHANGGRRHFPFTFMHYRRLERGRARPRPQWAGRFLAALRLSPGHDRYRDFLAAYLASILGERGYELLAAPLAAARPPSMSGPIGLRWLKERHVVHLTREQFEALLSTEPAYWCSELLFNDKGRWTAAELASRLGFSEAQVRRGLVTLASTGLVRRTPGGRYTARHAGKIYTFPGRLHRMGPLLERAKRYWERMAAKRGHEVSARVELVRAEASALLGYGVGLSEAVEGANLLSTQAAGHDTGLFLIEARIRRLLPF